MKNVDMNTYDYSDLILKLKELGRFLYVHNPGNAGDALIYYGMIELFKRNQITFEEYSEEAYKSCKKLVYSGGGNFIEHYDNCSNFIMSHFSTLEKFVLLPHSVSGNKLVLEKMDERFILFTREQKSYEYCKKITRSTSVILSHDLAMALGESEIDSRICWNFPGVSYKRKVKWILKMSFLKCYCCLGFSNFLRTDKEAHSNQKRSLINADLSRILMSGEDTHEMRMVTARALLALVKECTQINTDRLHIGIAAYLMKRKCNLSSGSYYKIEEVYKHSLKKKGGNVYFENTSNM